MRHLGAVTYPAKLLFSLRTRFNQGQTHFLTRISFLGLLVISASGIGHALLNPARGDSSGPATVVTSLVEGEATLDLVPAGFEDQLGYLPVPEAGTLVNPKGGCSTPGGVGPDVFDSACRVHDFGYDILRYAEESGTQVGPWARFDLDRRLYADLLQTCDTLTCGTTATVYYTAVTLNSIRQGYVAPTTEPITPWAGTVVGIVGLATATAPAEGHKWRRRTFGWVWTSLAILGRFGPSTRSSGREPNLVTLQREAELRGVGSSPPVAAGVRVGVGNFVSGIRWPMKANQGST